MLATALACLRSVELAAALSILQPNGRWRIGTSGEGGPILGLTGLPKQLRDLLEVNRVDLAGEPLPAGLIQLVPEPQQMLLPVWLELRGASRFTIQLHAPCSMLLAKKSIP